MKPNDMLYDYLPHEALELLDDMSDDLQRKLTQEILPLYANMSVLEAEQVGISVADYWDMFNSTEQVELNRLAEAEE